MDIRKRLLPAVLIVLLTTGCTLLCRETRILFFTVLAVVSAFEIDTVLKAARRSASKWICIVYIVCHAVLCWLRAEAMWLVALPALAAFAVFLQGILEDNGSASVIDRLFCLVWPFGFYALMIHAASSEIWLQTLAIAVLGAWACDCMALIGGKYWGKHKLAPRVSPNKTWEGAIVGAVSSILAGWLISLVLKRFAPVPAGACMLITFIASCFGQIGDLSASLIKRMAGVKDYGHLMPEHGGIMDKTDSMLFAVPAAYLCIRIMQLFP